MEIEKKILNSISKTVGKKQPLHFPQFLGNEKKYINECIDSTYVSSVGNFVNKFEDKIKEYTGSKFAICVVNGTSALQVSLLISGVGPRDEVLIPSLTFVATANAVSYCGATPHFIDININNLGIDATTTRSYLNKITKKTKNGLLNIKTKKYIKAIVPMHTFGHPCDMEKIIELAEDFNLTIIEDSTEALGSYFKNRHVGTFGKAGTLSFNGNKIITTGGGGCIITDDESFAKKAKHITTTAKLSHDWEYIHDEIGFNYRMPNINAAIGLAQIEKIDVFLENKRNLFREYKKNFENIEEIKLFKEPANCKSNYWLQSILINSDTYHLKNKILKLLNDKGYMSRPVWMPLHMLDPYKKCPSTKLINTVNIYERLINIPSSYVPN